MVRFLIFDVSLVKRLPHRNLTLVSFLDAFFEVGWLVSFCDPMDLMVILGYRMPQLLHVGSVSQAQAQAQAHWLAHG